MMTEIEIETQILSEQNFLHYKYKSQPTLKLKNFFLINKTSHLYKF